MLGFIKGNKPKKNKNPMAGTGIDPNKVTIKTYKPKKTTLKAASKKKRPNDKQTEKKTTKKSRNLSENKVVTVNTTFTLNPPEGSIGILPTTYDVTIQMKGHARVISQEKKTVVAKEPKGDLSTKYKYHINKLLLEHIDLTKNGIDDTILVANEMNLSKEKKEAAIKLLKNIKKATKPKINADIVKWLKGLKVKVTLTGTKKVGDNTPTTLMLGKSLTEKPRLQDDMSAEEYLGETLFLGLKF